MEFGTTTIYDIEINANLDGKLSGVLIKDEEFNLQQLNDYNEDLNVDILKDGPEIQLPIKKKKGRKSKKDKLLEIQNAKPPEPIKVFPTLNEKIFDVVEIGGKEYFYDSDFNKLLDSNVNYIGYKLNGKFIFYDNINDDNEYLKNDNDEVQKILKNFGFGKVEL